ncbi:MAG: efflux RND transporter periplasmic adaptor subunit [Synergistaceae bacterium]
MSSTEKKSNSTKWIVTVIVVILLAVGGKYAYGMYLAQQKAAAKASQQEQPAPTVIVEKASKTELSYKNEYVGKVIPIQTVELKPQVSGEIMKVNFKEGSIVKKGQVLFQIDSRQYYATVSLRKAELSKAKATLDRADKYLKRLQSADKRSISASDLELAESNYLQAKAAVEEAKASLTLANINLNFTNVTAPITGRIGAALFTKGNYVTPASGAIANIVQMDPIRVSFNMPDRDYIDQLNDFKKKGSVYETTLILSNGDEVKVSGERDFEDNKIDDKTGTLMVRIRFNNKKGELVPGSMVRVKTTAVAAREAIVVSQEALVGDSQGDYIYVVENGTAVQRRVVLGEEVGTLREVKEGLAENETVVIKGIQSIRNGIKVQAKEETPVEAPTETSADKTVTKTENPTE